MCKTKTTEFHIANRAQEAIVVQIEPEGCELELESGREFRICAGYREQPAVLFFEGRAEGGTQYVRLFETDVADTAVIDEEGRDVLRSLRR